MSETFPSTDITESTHTHDEELRGVSLYRPRAAKGLSDAAFSSLQLNAEEERDGVTVILTTD